LIITSFAELVKSLFEGGELNFKGRYYEPLKKKGTFFLTFFGNISGVSPEGDLRIFFNLAREKVYRGRGTSSGNLILMGGTKGLGGQQLSMI